MSRNLQIIQKTSKVLEILSKICYIFCLVGAIICIAAVVALSIMCFFPDLVAKVQEDGRYTMLELIGTTLAGAIICIGELIVAKAHKDYFVMEQKDGTPFTVDGAKAFRTLGIMNIVVPIVISIIVIVFGQIFDSWKNVRMDVSLGLGIAMILLSYVFAYGAELEEKKGQGSVAAIADKGDSEK